MSMGAGGSKGKQASEQISQPNQFQNVAMAMMLSSLLPKDAFDMVAPYVLPPNLLMALGQSGQDRVVLPPQYPPSLKEGRQPIAGINVPNINNAAMPGVPVGTSPAGGFGSTKSFSQPSQAKTGATQGTTGAGTAGADQATLANLSSVGVPSAMFGSLYDALAGTIPTASSVTDYIQSLKTPNIPVPSFLLGGS